MSPGTSRTGHRARRRTAAVVVGLVLTAGLAACGGSGDSTGTSSAVSSASSGGSSAATSAGSSVGSSAAAKPTPGTAPATVEARCGTNTTLTQPLPTPFTFTTADGVTLLGVEFGTGPKGVVALHQLGRAGLCGWLSYGQYLAAQGLHVLAFDHRCVGLSTCPTGTAQGDSLADITAAREELLRRGATTTALLGASQGGGEAIAAAGSQTGWTKAAVLSGAIFTTDFGGGVTATTAMPSVQIPVLFEVAADDPDSPLAADQALVATAPAGIVTLEVLPSGGHGWSLLQPLPGDPFTDTAAKVAAFLAA